jgi:hypothetical protein
VKLAEEPKEGKGRGKGDGGRVIAYIFKGVNFAFRRVGGEVSSLGEGCA